MSIIQNLTVAGEISISNFNDSSKICTIGGIIASARGSVLNCRNEVNISLENFVCKNLYAGGICGNLGIKTSVSKIIGCVNTGNISCSANLGNTANPAYAAGIAGTMTYHPQIESCKNAGAISVHLIGFAKGYAGGITM